MRWSPEIVLPVHSLKIFWAALQRDDSEMAPTSTDQLIQHCAPDWVRQRLRGDDDNELPLLQTWPMSVLQTERVAVWLPEQLQRHGASVSADAEKGRADIRHGAVAALAGLQGGLVATVDGVDAIGSEDAIGAEVVRLDDIGNLFGGRCSDGSRSRA